MRDAQRAAVTKQGAAYAVNSDHGAGCDIHPPPKQFCGRRLGDSALAMVYNQKISWQSPSYKAVKAVSRDSAVIQLDSYVNEAGLVLRPSANTGTLNCSANPNVCATAMLQFNDRGKTWVEAKVGLTADRQGMVARPFRSVCCYSIVYLVLKKCFLKYNLLMNLTALPCARFCRLHPRWVPAPSLAPAMVGALSHSLRCTAPIATCRCEHGKLRWYRAHLLGEATVTNSAGRACTTCILRFCLLVFFPSVSRIKSTLYEFVPLSALSSVMILRTLPVAQQGI